MRRVNFIAGLSRLLPACRQDKRNNSHSHGVDLRPNLEPVPHGQTRQTDHMLDQEHITGLRVLEQSEEAQVAPASRALCVFDIRSDDRQAAGRLQKLRFHCEPGWRPALRWRLGGKLLRACGGSHPVRFAWFLFIGSLWIVKSLLLNHVAMVSPMCTLIAPRYRMGWRPKVFHHAPNYPCHPQSSLSLNGRTARASAAMAPGDSPFSTRRTWTSGIRKVPPTRTAKPGCRMQVRQAVVGLTPVRRASSPVEANCTLYLLSAQALNSVNFLKCPRRSCLVFAREKLSI